MQAVLLIGIPATGKSTFFRQRFFDTHVRLNLDMLRTRYRESLLLNACLEGKTPFVVDNTNVKASDRAVYIGPARAAGFSVIGYYFQSKASEALVRNAARQRSKSQHVPPAGVLGQSARLELPSLAEGFDELYYASIEPSPSDANGSQFKVEAWREDEPGANREASGGDEV